METREFIAAEAVARGGAWLGPWRPLCALRPDEGRPGDLWSGQGRAWQRWRRGGPFRRGPLLAVAIVAALVVVLVLPVLAEDAPDPCTALEKRMGRLLSAPGMLQGFGEHGRYARAAAWRDAPLLPPVVVCTAAWWHVAVMPSAAGRWFASMR